MVVLSSCPECTKDSVYAAFDFRNGEKKPAFQNFFKPILKTKRLKLTEIIFYKSHL